MRLSLIVVFGRLEIPDVVRAALRFVPAAVLSAIVLPELLRPVGSLNLSFGNHRLLAGLLASLMAWRTRNVFLTIGTGMAALWAFQTLR